jgi:hypothetical protein
MIGLGFQLGLHGHQHLAAATTHYVHLSESQAMAVVSAGSLCAGARELPRGINRQYTIITIDDDYRHARVHVREMVEGEQFTRKNNGAFVQGYAEITWQASTDSAGRAIDAQLENDRRATLAAEAALQSNKLEDALAALKNTKLSEGSYARVIAVQAALRAANWPFLARIIDPPHTREEAAILVSALTKMNSLDQASIILKQQEDLDAGTRAGLEEQIAIKRMMNGI